MSDISYTELGRSICILIQYFSGIFNFLLKEDAERKLNLQNIYNHMQNIQHEVDIQTPKQFISRMSYYHRQQVEQNPKTFKQNKIRGRTKQQNRGMIRDSRNLYNILGKQPILKKLITKAKTQRLVLNFINKLKLNVTNSQPPQVSSEIKKSSKTDLSKYLTELKGIQLNTFQAVFMVILGTIITLILTIVFSLEIVFQQISNTNGAKLISMVALIFYTCEIILNFISQKHKRGKYLIHINQIFNFYLREQFLVDFLTILTLVLELGFNCHFEYLRIVILFKLWKIICKLDQIQYLLITNFIREQYWGLFGVIMTNFTVAHILAIILNCMALINQHNNWLIVHGIQNSVWYQKYIWGYYWGTTLMLTIGFGDFAASNCEQALCLIFISMFSCIILGYNINCVGNLISNLRSSRAEKYKNLKTFSIMSRANNIQAGLSQNINNFIEGKYIVQKQYNLDEENSLLRQLAPELKDQYLIQANTKIFRQITLFKSLTEKTLQNLAKKIQKKITHPQQVILRRKDNSKIIILQKGKLGFVINNNTLKNKQEIIDTIESATPLDIKLVSLDFLKGKNMNYDIKSLNYSILYYFEDQNFTEHLKDSDLDFEHVCMLRDREESILNEYQIYKCKLCFNQYHNKFKCSKLHFIPIRQHVINKYLAKTHKQQQVRIFRKTDRTSRKRSRYLKQKRLNLDSQPLLGSGELPTIEIQRNSKKVIKQFTFESKDKWQKNMVDLFYEQMNKSETNFWTVETDLCYDWKYYFPASNLKNMKSIKKNKVKKAV